MLAATRRSAASITAAPVSIVDNRISWPGQSTNETCLRIILGAVLDKVQLVFALGTWRGVLGETSKGLEALRLRALRTLINLGIGISQSNGDIPHLFLLEANSAA